MYFLVFFLSLFLKVLVLDREHRLSSQRLRQNEDYALLVVLTKNFPVKIREGFIVIVPSRQDPED